MELTAYRFGMGSERKHKNVRLPATQFDLINGLAEWRVKAGLDDDLNWTAALSFVVRFFEAVGGFDKPEDAMNRIIQASKDARPRKG